MVVSAYATVLFQFHYGSIKGTYADRLSHDQFLFQFHYGSIKGVKSTGYQGSLVSFNSTMVRLKEAN